MATFKSLLEKAMLKIGGRSCCLPSITMGGISVTTDTYTAPTDGIIACRGTGYVGFIAFQSISYGNESSKYSSSIWLPVKKGQTVEIYKELASDLIVCFCSTVGGGRKLLLSVLNGGRSLCLPLSNYWTRWLGKGVRSRCLTQAVPLSSIRQAVMGQRVLLQQFTLLQRMAGLPLRRVTRVAIQLFSRCRIQQELDAVRIFTRPNAFPSATSVSPLKRERVLRLFGVQHSGTNAISFPFSAKLNFCGGAQ